MTENEVILVSVIAGIFGIWWFTASVTRDYAEAKRRHEYECFKADIEHRIRMLEIFKKPI